MKRHSQSTPRPAKRLVQLAGLLFLLALPALALAGGTGGGDEFSEIYEWVKGIVQGTLGRLIALVMIIVGVAAGVARGSIFAFVIGLAAAIGFYFTPDIIEQVMGASLTVVG